MELSQGKSNLEIKQKTSMGIRGRLLLGFSAVILICFIAVCTSFFIITVTKNFATKVITNDLPTFNHFLDLGEQVYLSEVSIQTYLLTNDKTFKAEFERSWNNIDHILVSLDDLEKTWTNTEIIKMWQIVKPQLEQLKTAQNKIINVENTTNKAEISQLFVTIVHPIANKLMDVLDGPIIATGERTGGMFDIQYAQLQSGSEKIITDMNTVQVTEIVLFVIGVLAAILIAILTARSILRHINIFREYSGKIAKGDLRQFLTLQSNDEIGQLGKDLNVMTGSLASVAKQITEACHNMVSSLEEVRQAVDSQSSGATEQAASINEITSSLEEIEKSSSQTMEKAKTLGDVAERTREKGQLGLDAVQQSIQGMKAVRDKVQVIAQTILDLSNQTQQVGEITTVVNTLAQQSKMLALNASIEAAKAGEAGKGFTVVAAEVKNLAEQSEQSTAQVQKILEDIKHATEKAVMVTEEGTKGVDHGTGLVEQTGDIVRSLSDAVNEASIASQQIEAAIRQESVGIEQITAGMNEINQVTATFVDGAKQTMEAINNLSVIAKNLKAHIDVYKI